MQYEDKLKAFRDKLELEYHVAADTAESIVQHTHDLVQSETERAAAILESFKGHVELHPFIYVALAAIAGSAVTIAAVFVAKF